MRDFGKVIAMCRNNLNISQNKLAYKIGYKREYISQIERGVRPVPYKMLVPLSTALKYDFLNLFKSSDEYESFEHFRICQELVATINEKNIKQMMIKLDEVYSNKELGYGTPQIIIRYCEAYLQRYYYNDNNKSVNICLEILGLSSLDEIHHLKIKLYMDDRYYQCITLLTSNLHDLREYSYGITLSKGLVTILESNYFSNGLSSNLSTFFIKKLYIAALNNYSHFLNTINDQVNALLYCNKAIEFSKFYNISYMFEYLLKLKVEILYTLENYDNAKTEYKYFQTFCAIVGNHAYLCSTEHDFKDIYPKLFN